jgi:hypothetical protein
MLTAATVLTKQAKHTKAATQARGNDRKTSGLAAIKLFFLFLSAQ